MAEYLNLQVAKSGFGSYLTNIVPEDIAITSGAFSAAMQQIRNITSIPIEKFAQIVNSIETIKGLDSVNGTSVPVDTSLANQGLNLTAKGTGPYGTYTFSDFFGCMSGLPYHWKDIQQNIIDASTPLLFTIYRELYLAVSWKAATGTVTVSRRAELVSTSPDVYDYYYTITGISLDIPGGGGYGRGGAPNPTVAFNYNGNPSAGATASTQIGRDDSGDPLDSGYTFGKITLLSLTSPGSETLYGSGSSSSPPSLTITLEIQAPPTAYSSSYSGLSNTSYGTTGWKNPMNATVQQHIDAANAEIRSIFSSKPNVSKALNINYDMAGTQLTIEQRSRYLAIPPVPAPRDRFVNLYPTSQEVFVDTIPEMAQDTMPHGAAQTVEAITDVCNPGGQAIIGLMRESRNALRLQEIGIEQDNNIPDVLDPALVPVLMSNGSIPGARNGIDVPNTGQKFTNPSNLGISDCLVGDSVLPQPLGFIDPATNAYRITNPLFDGQGGITQNNPVLGPLLNAAIDGLQLGLVILTGPVQPIGIGVPSQTGSPVLPDSFAGSPYRNVLPPNLNSAMTSGTLTPSIYSVQEAIDEVIRCNCDCWVQ